ncbi:MAG: DUF3299 domain-containing protein [Oceanicoccus sp.]|uniref:DUF3299 domain-containing protein n=1 Tax=Oceanicoccus sp. TaxID=2691044 RepID=UPI002619D73C|nr:DUF3299 domain-containing protein [Oceanicoccus sp.]MDG1773897.1 DUF3299 domain-containing protein [Oceanicoccus sp.]
MKALSFYKTVVLLFVLSVLAATTLQASNSPAKKPATPTEFKTIQWPDLMPQADLDALLNPPEYLANIEDGSAEDQISSQISSSIAAAKDDRYQQALVSTNIRPEMNGRGIRIPGFIVPLEFSDDQVITEFFIVPFFGACIHVPPPPPNQIIHVKYPKGFKLEALYNPFWLSGVLKTTLIENDMATAAYAMEVHLVEEYAEP